MRICSCFLKRRARLVSVEISNFVYFTICFCKVFAVVQGVDNSIKMVNTDLFRQICLKIERCAGKFIYLLELGLKVFFLV